MEDYPESVLLQQSFLDLADPEYCLKSKKSRMEVEIDRQSQLLAIACEALSKSDVERDLAKVWAYKLKSLTSDQKLLAEKFINDILFEAQMGKLTRHSVKIRGSEDIYPSSVSYPSTSTSSEFIPILPAPRITNIPSNSSHSISDNSSNQICDTVARFFSNYN